MSEEAITHNLIIEFGKHKGERWTRLPVSYLRWLVNEASGEAKDLAEIELKRRGTTVPATVELSGHAIDRASQITRVWERQGVYSWLQQRAEEALKTATEEKQVEIVFKGLKFVFSYGEYYPILKTVIQKNKFKNK